ncbi:MAG: cytochrome C oxidase subunit IV family protein [Actinobacteria bacterium]|nr:cytochrome C oxidase subunit IV family protein [Actinomycetota bacterium]
MAERSEELLERAEEHHAERVRARRGRPAQHPGPRAYVRIAVILGVITLAEVWIYYVDSLRFLLVPFLLAFSALKFSLVVLYFMHLRFDSRSFAALFVAGLALALTVFVVVLLIFGTFAG